MTAKMGKLYKELYFPVKASPITEITPCLIRPTVHQIHSMGFSTEGRVVLGAMVKNSSVGRGENIELSIACRNDSACNIKYVEIEIVEYLSWNLGKTDRQDSSQTLKSIKSVALPSTTKAISRKEIGRRSIGTLFKEIHSELRAQQQPVLVSVPVTARDSYQGRLVNVWHCVKVTFATRSVSNNAVAIIPIRVGTAPTPENHYQPPPPEAHPNNYQRLPRPIPPPQMTPISRPLSPVNEDGPLQEEGEGESSNSFPVMIAPEDLIILGADAINRRDVTSSDAGSVVTAPPTVRPKQPQPPSMKELLLAMQAAVSDFDLLTIYLMDKKWRRFFSTISPSNYGAIIENVKTEVDHPRVAVMLAPHLNHDNFICAYAAAAVKHCSVSYKSVTVKRLLPMCQDVEQNYRLILAELNEWERIATSNDFELALLSASHDV